MAFRQAQHILELGTVCKQHSGVQQGSQPGLPPYPESLKLQLFLPREDMWPQSLQLCLTLCHPVDSIPPRSSVHGISSGKNTGVGCHALLQGIFPTQRVNICLLNRPHCRQIVYPLGHLESPPENTHCANSHRNVLDALQPRQVVTVRHGPNPSGYMSKFLVLIIGIK